MKKKQILDYIPIKLLVSIIIFIVGFLTALFGLSITSQQNEGYSLMFFSFGLVVTIIGIMSLTVYWITWWEEN